MVTLQASAEEKGFIFDTKLDSSVSKVKKFRVHGGVF